MIIIDKLSKLLRKVFPDEMQIIEYRFELWRIPAVLMARRIIVILSTWGPLVVKRK